MCENIYSDFHIEKLKSVVTGWTINRPKIEKICLFKGCESNSDDQDEKKCFYKYWLVIVGPDELEGWVQDLNDQLSGRLYDHNRNNPRDELMLCFVEEKEITDNWFIFRIPPEWYVEGSWTFEENVEFNEENVELRPPVYGVIPRSELVLFERTGFDETPQQICRRIATELWRRFPTMRKCYVMGHPDIINIREQFTGKNTIADWIGPAPATAKKGRLSKDEKAMQKIMCSEAGIPWPGED
jgi:hypothetical protein